MAHKEFSIMALPSDLTADNVLLAAVQTNKRAEMIAPTRRRAQNLITDSTTIVVNLDSNQPSLGSIGDLQMGSAIMAIGNCDGNSFNAQVIIVLEKDTRNLLKKFSPYSTVPLPNPGA